MSKFSLKIASGLVVAAFGLSGCGLLDVENPNNIVEESLGNVAAASAIVNGAEATVARGHGQMLPVYATLADELFWIGSRDAWQQLDFGIMTDPANEFTDGAFPEVNEGRWMSDLAVTSLQGFVAEDPGNTALTDELARANLIAGVSYMFIGTMFEDFVFSDKKEAGTPVGPANMASVLASSVSYLNDAVSNSAAASETNNRALAVRSRAAWEAAAWSKQNSPTPATPLISDAQADADALAAIAALGGVTTDWRYQFTYGPAEVASSIAGWVNQRSEMQFGERYVTNDAPDAINDITGVALMDPIDGVDAPYVQQYIIDEFSTQTDYSSLTIVSTRRLHLQLAESALAGGDTGGFATHVNHVRAMDGLTDYSGQIPEMDMLMYMRQANLILEASRLGDLYRFGLQSDNWQAGSPAITNPGLFLPITNIELLSNPNVG